MEVEIRLSKFGVIRYNSSLKTRQLVSRANVSMLYVRKKILFSKFKNMSNRLFLADIREDNFWLQ